MRSKRFGYVPPKVPVEIARLDLTHVITLVWATPTRRVRWDSGAVGATQGLDQHIILWGKKWRLCSSGYAFDALLVATSFRGSEAQFFNDLMVLKMLCAK